jgi:50S ribosomal protein L16 3-hydroxylase
MTCSVGFRSPWRADLAKDLLQRLMGDDDQGYANRMYVDPKQPATAQPGMIPEALQLFAQDAVERALRQPLALERALGEALTEPKARVWFEPGATLPQGAGVSLDRRSRLMYDDHHVFINGESFLAAGRDQRLIRLLADQHALSADQVAQLSAGARELLDQWAEDGWVQAAGA